MNKEIENINNKNQYHGYQEWYPFDNVVTYRGNYKNGRPIGYGQLFLIKEVCYFIK